MADVTVTVASVLQGASAVLALGTAGATLSAGQPFYKDSSDGDKLKPCDANASAASAVCVGIGLHGALDEHPIQYQTGGRITIGGTLVVGMVYVVSGNAGGIAPITDLASGWYTTILGIAVSTTVLDLGIKVGGVAHVP